MKFIKFKTSGKNTVIINTDKVEMAQRSGEIGKTVLFFRADSAKGIVVEESFENVFEMLNK